ncbi:hypothetical protein J4461_02495 [Candidatus Pacearchaeota archaeon]|nr:hypothetical protein [Candidatus Pacearchaeota archaeon]
MPSTRDVLKKYAAKIESEMSDSSSPQGFSKEYLQFKDENIPEINRYERWAKTLGTIISLKVSEKDSLKMQKFLKEAHVSITPSQALALSITTLIGALVLVLAIALSIFFIGGSFPFLFTFLGILASLSLFYYVYTEPQRLANSWKLKASAQMVPAVLYVVVYMKHTSNLERAIAFASEHLEGPLALDFKKIFYDVEVAKFSSIKQSFNAYLDRWKEYSPEFVESFHLIESSLYEPTEARRIQILEKALQVILDGVYENMLKYSREIRAPLTNVYMLGIILPTLTLALLPLAATLLQGIIAWYHVMLFFNILVPIYVWYLSSQVLLKRPGGYGDASILEKNPDYPLFISRKPWIISSLIALPILIIGLIPIMIQFGFFPIESTLTLGEIGLPFLTNQSIGELFGPVGLGGLLLSLCVPLSIALFFAIAYRKKTKKLIVARDDTKELEKEFTNSLFQLGNRLGDGIPAEIAFAKVAESTQGQKTQAFLSLVNQNIQQLGMSLDRAIFDKKRGAILFFPSSLISTSMRILVESTKKGLRIAAQSLMSISEYVKNIEKINQRLRDLLAEITSDMRSNMTFLAPLLAGIVVGLASMITSILLKMESLQKVVLAGGELGDLSYVSKILNIFSVEAIIAPAAMQMIVGIYIIELVYILTVTLVTVNSGKDILKEKYEFSRNLMTALPLYLIAAALASIALTILSSLALGGLA